jgi:dolichol-phosphate mannosyltransferase
MIWMLAARLLFLLQAGLGLRVAARLLGTAGAERIQPTAGPVPPAARVSILVPVLNEERRLQPCLEGLLGQGAEVVEILVVDGGSTDRTPELVERAAGRDPRVRLVSAAPIPDGWNGKAWALEYGLQRADRGVTWLLTLDADVRPRSGLARALVAQARRSGAAALSVATLQEIDGLGTALVHPALLATLVYRFGIPGRTTSRPAEAQANGQCMLLARQALDQVGGFHSVGGSLCEDVTLARLLAAQGWPVGFYESDGLVSARMYEGGWEAWRCWRRSLPLRDGLVEASVLVGLLEVLLVQGLPGALSGLAALPPLRGGLPAGLLRLNAALVAMRFGILFGMARAYAERPWSYWLSPLLDLPVALALIASAFQPEHRWRGRLVRRGAVG